MSQLLLPLCHLAAAEAPVRRTLDLEPGVLRPWIDAVRTSADACLVLDDRGRLAAVSPTATVLLDLDDDIEGVDFCELVRAVDFSADAQPVPDQHLSLPPLQALRAGITMRAIVRLRRRDASLVTLDVVSAVLSPRAGTLTFVQVV